MNNQDDVSTSVLNPQIGLVEEQILPRSSVFEDGRALQGQSKHLFNLQIGVEDPENESKETILVN